jgi:hypothetical protein
MNDETRQKTRQAGELSAERILEWLDRGGRAQVQIALQQAIKQTERRNKARELDPNFLEQRVTF